jgi:hypothetical protein
MLKQIIYVLTVHTLKYTELMTKLTYSGRALTLLHPGTIRTQIQIWVFIHHSTMSCYFKIICMSTVKVVLNEYLSYSNIRRLRWSSGLRAGLWFPSSRVRTRPMPLDFLCKKSSARLPSEGKLNNLSHVPTLGHVKNPFSRGLITGCRRNSFDRFPPSLTDGSRAAWCDGASRDEWGN